MIRVIGFEFLTKGESLMDDGMKSILGWVIFFLIFVVGNGILYLTTGIFFIPIPRR